MMISNSSDEREEETAAQMQHKCKVITPTIEYLNNAQILTDILCTVPNCNELFSNTSALNLHLKKVHKLEPEFKVEVNTDIDSKYLNTTTRTRAQRLVENCQCKYYCPASNCKYNFKIGSGARFLPTFHSLKVHFIRIHGEKMHSCSKCSRKFSIKSEMCRHEEKCGQLFKCSCGCPFSTIELLVKHAQVQSHCIPPYSELLKSNKSSFNDNSGSSEPLSKKQAVKVNKTALKPLKPATMSHQPNIIIINNITSSTTPFQLETKSKQHRTNAQQPSLFKLPRFESHQRSLGCQTQLLADVNKIETASQTPILNVCHPSSSNTYTLHHQIQPVHFMMSTGNDACNYEVFKYYETQQTQTTTNETPPAPSYHHFDASTSPLNTFNADEIINDDQFWAEMSTQTFLSAFEHSNNNQQHQQVVSSTTTQTLIPNTNDSLNLSFDLNNREMQTETCDLQTTYTQTSQSTNATACTTACETDTDLDFIDTIILNSYTTSETQTQTPTSHEQNILPLHSSTATETEFESFIQTNSIQTQTFNEFLVDNITQTPWEMNICEDDFNFPV